MTINIVITILYLRKKTEKAVIYEYFVLSLYYWASPQGLKLNATWVHRTLPIPKTKWHIACT